MFVKGFTPAVELDGTNSLIFYGIVRTPPALIQMSVVQFQEENKLKVAVNFRYPIKKKASLQEYGLEDGPEAWDKLNVIFDKLARMVTNLYGFKPEIIKKDLRGLTHDQVIDWFETCGEFNIKRIKSSVKP